MRRFWILLGAFVVTLTTLGLALFLGAWGFEFYAENELERRLTRHEGALQRVMEKEPTIDLLTRGLADGGTVVLSAPETPEDVQRIIATYGDAAADDLRQKARLWPSLRVYRSAEDIVYFIFFDDDDVMRGFACVAR